MEAVAAVEAAGGANAGAEAADAGVGAGAGAGAVPASEPLALRVLKHSWRGTYSRLLRLSPAGTWLGLG